MSSKATLGFNAGLYYLSAGNRASWGSATSGVATAAPPGNLTVVQGIMDVKIGISFDKAAANIRDGLGFKMTEPALCDLPITFKLLDLGYNNATQQYLLQQAAQRLPVSIAALNALSTVSGAFGVWADYKIFKFEEAQPINELDTWDVELNPCFSAIPPQFVSVT